MRSMFLAILSMAACTPLYAQVQTCPPGTEDMMNYFVMAYPQRISHHMGPGNANPIYTHIVPELGSKFARSGHFLWMKSSSGYPWDVKSFDENYIYDRTTELQWTNPTTFKRFDVDLPLSKRCVRIGQEGEIIKIPAAKTKYTLYANCQPTRTQALGYVLNRVSAPGKYTGGNLGTIAMRDFIYQYSCDSNYANCTYQEIFTLGYHLGQVRWRYFVNQNGVFRLAKESDINWFDSGSATPYLPCTSSYQ